MGAYVCAFIENWQSSSVKFTQREEILPQETANHYQLAKPKQTNESKPEMNCKRHWGKAAPLYDYLILCEQCVCTLTETSSSPPDARQHRFKLNIIEHLCQTGAVLCLITTWMRPRTVSSRGTEAVSPLTHFCKMLNIVAVGQHSTDTHLSFGVTKSPHLAVQAPSHTLLSAHKM